MSSGRAVIFLVSVVAIGAFYYGGQPAPIEPASATGAAPEVSAEPTVAEGPFVATVANEHRWQAERVPAAWPEFSKLPGAKPLPAKTVRQKIDLANSVNARWQVFRDKGTRPYPTSAESGRAIEYMLTIDPKAPEFPEAWATFIKLRQVDRSISTETALDGGRKLLEARSKDRGVSIGMTADQIRASNWGKPKTINETLTARGKHEQWVYGGGYLYLDDGVLTSIQTSSR